MADQYAGAPFLQVPELSLFEAVAVPISPEQDSSVMVTAAAAAARTGHCLPGAPSSQVPCHPSLLALVGNDAAAVVAECSEEPKTAALTAADHVGNFELQVVGNAVDLATSGYQKSLKTADPDPDQMNQGSPHSIAQTTTKDCQSSSHCQHLTGDRVQRQHPYHRAGYFPVQRAPS